MRWRNYDRHEQVTTSSGVVKSGTRVLHPRDKVMGRVVNVGWRRYSRPKRGRVGTWSAYVLWDGTAGATRVDLKDIRVANAVDLLAMLADTEWPWAAREF